MVAIKEKRGRKPIAPEERVIQVNFYTKQSFITNVGGIEKAREIVKKHLESI